ncbi:MAG: hypothetical protein HXS43_12015 [Theionarchaea archaeon]|nr:hypothetical protein [Theionarchaea archaeon]
MNKKSTLASFGYEGLDPSAGEIITETVDYLRNHIQEGLMASPNTDNTKYDVTAGWTIVGGANVFVDAVSAVAGPGANKTGCLQVDGQGVISFYENADKEPEDGKVKICDLITDASSVITVDNTTKAVCPSY